MNEHNDMNWDRHFNAMQSKASSGNETVPRGRNPLDQIYIMLPQIRQETDRIKINRANSMDSIKGIILSLLAFLEAIITVKTPRQGGVSVMIETLKEKQTDLLNEYLLISNLENDTQMEASDHQIALVEKIMVLVQESLI